MNVSLRFPDVVVMSVRVALVWCCHDCGQVSCCLEFRGLTFGAPPRPPVWQYKVKKYWADVITYFLAQLSVGASGLWYYNTVMSCKKPINRIYCRSLVLVLIFASLPIVTTVCLRCCVNLGNGFVDREYIVCYTRGTLVAVFVWLSWRLCCLDPSLVFFIGSCREWEAGASRQHAHNTKHNLECLCPYT